MWCATDTVVYIDTFGLIKVNSYATDSEQRQLFKTSIKNPNRPLVPNLISTICQFRID